MTGEEKRERKDVPQFFLLPIFMGDAVTHLTHLFL